MRRPSTPEERMAALDKLIKRGLIAAPLKTEESEREGGMNDNPTVNEIAKVYFEKHSQPKGNRMGDEAVLRSPLLVFGELRAHNITHNDIDAYTELRMGGIKPVSTSTVRRELVALQAVLNYGSKRGMVEGEKIFRFQKPPEGKPRDLWLTEEQETEVLDHMVSAPVSVRLFTKLALTYGCRKGALMDLKFGDQVNFITGVIDFQDPNKAQNRKRRTSVPITPDILVDLEVLFQAKNGKGRVLDYDTPYRYSKFMKSIGYSWATPHVLKHSAITLMLRAGVKLEDVAKLTATDERTLLKVYRHHSFDELLTIAGARR